MPSQEFMHIMKYTVTMRRAWNAKTYLLFKMHLDKYSYIFMVLANLWGNITLKTDNFFSANVIFNLHVIIICVNIPSNGLFSYDVYIQRSHLSCGFRK